jgi:hypothetical protein
MKFREYLALMSDDAGFIPTPHLRRVIRKNTRPTAREEAIAASVLEQANPRDNISGHAGWDKEETVVLQQLWIQPESGTTQWRDVPTLDSHLYSTTESGMPVPNAVRQPEAVPMDLYAKVRQALGQE